MHFVLPPWIGVSILVCVSTGALLRGELDERVAAVGLLANVGVTVLLRDRSWPHLQWTGFAADMLLLLLLLILALRSAKFWPLPAAAFQLLATVTHVAKLVDPNVQQWAYFTAIVIWTYALIITLGVGVWNCWRGERYLVNAALAPAPAETRR